MSGITVTEVVADHGSIVVLRGIEHETDRVVTFGADHRPAQAIADALAEGEDVEVYDVEDWQILSRGTVPSTNHEEEPVTEQPASSQPSSGEDANPSEQAQTDAATGQQDDGQDEAVQRAQEAAAPTQSDVEAQNAREGDEDA